MVDSSASGTYIIIDQNEKVVDSGTISQEDIVYTVLLPLKPGIYTLVVYSTNNDLEWDGDEETLVTTTKLI